MRKIETENTWLEPVLRRGLRRAPAPPALWNRIAGTRLEEAHSEPKQTFIRVLACASLATASLLAVAWGYYPNARVDFRSDQVTEVRNWIRSRTGFDIPFTAQPDRRVEMMHASIASTGTVEVRYRAANQDALLVVSRSSGGLPDHHHLRDIESLTSVSWTSGRQAYTLSVQRAGDMRSACLVCHTESTI